jgi:hypothetical protein
LSNQKGQVLLKNISHGYRTKLGTWKLIDKKSTTRKSEQMDHMKVVKKVIRKGLQEDLKARIDKVAEEIDSLLKI